jgi:putative transposase
MLNVISRSRGCGKCGKAEAFFAEAFPSSWWKSSRRSCRRPPLSISTAAAFSTALRARRLVRLAVEETDIRNGKDSSKVRSRFQTPTRRANRSGGVEHGAGRARLSTRAQRAGTLARSVSEQQFDRSSIGSGTTARSREPEAEGQDRRPGDADGPFKKMADLGSTAEKRRYLRDYRDELGSVSKACQVTGLASSTFYYKPDPHHRKRRDDEDEELRQQIERIHEEFPGYGYRRLQVELNRRGVPVNGKRIRRVMKKFGLKPITWCTFVPTTDSRHALPVYPNLIKNRQIRAINQAWVADITYIRIRSSFVYLAAILDLYSRRIVGWAISKRIDTELCVTALRMALETRPTHGCIHHSDRGAQYASASYVALLRQYGLQISMSAKGNPYDNAFMESFYKTLKYEEVHLWNYETYDDVIERLPFFLEEVYNRKRLHSSIGYVPPAEFEAAVLNMKPADRPVLNL